MNDFQLSSFENPIVQPFDDTLCRVMSCLDCGTALDEGPHCAGCGRVYEPLEGVIEAIGPPRGRNRIVAAFYDGPGWRRFRPWERLFLKLQGGTRRARFQVLRHLLTLKDPQARVLEVGVGDGANRSFLPNGWDLVGVDIARGPMREALQRDPRFQGRLVHAEAERLPFVNGAFDACFSLGGFTYFEDHEAALAEMRRVTKPGGPLVVADELHGLHRAGIGHLIGRPAIDAAWLRALGLDPEFIEMVFQHQFNLTDLHHRLWPQARRYRIWFGLGYCLVDAA